MPAKSSVYEPLDGEPLDEEGESLGSRPNPEGSAGCCSRAFIHWMWPMLKVGRRRKLEESDMYPLMEGEKAEHIAAKFEREWAATAGAKGAPWRRMLRTLWAMEGPAFAAMFMQKLAGDSLRFCTPLALEQVIGWLMDENAPAPWWSSFLPPAYRGLYYVFIMTAATVLQCFCYSLSNLGANRVGTHVRTTITVGVYKKSLTQALCARGETTTGKVVNLIASDATRLMWSECRSPLSLFLKRLRRSCAQASRGCTISPPACSSSWCRSPSSGRCSAPRCSWASAPPASRCR